MWSSGRSELCAVISTSAVELRLRRLTPVLDDVLKADEGEHAAQAVGIASPVQPCSHLKADRYVISHSTPEWTADAQPELVRA
jgi:hypothetical protein